MLNVTERRCEYTLTKQQLIEDNMNLVYSLVSREYPAYLYDEDIIQTGMLGLCKAAERWDETKSKFSNFAWHCIRNEIIDEFKRRAKHQGVLSLDYEVDGDDGERLPFSSFVVGQEDVGYVDVEVNVEKLTPTQLKVFKLCKIGVPTKEIARTLGVSRQCVWQTMRKLRIMRGKK